jgi:hypothetical protein
MSHSEKNEPTQPIRGPGLKLEMAANIGPIADNLAQRISGDGQAGGESVSQLPLKDKAFSTFLDQNPPFKLRPEKGGSPHRTLIELSLPRGAV